MVELLRNSLLADFLCTGDACVDTCCKNWSMQLDDATYNRYVNDAPELLNAVAQDDDGSNIMRKDPVTTYCVKLDNGRCSIQLAKGDAFLGDACHFYPRVTRALGSQPLMTATLSCPEITRLALFTSSHWGIEPAEIDRLPHQLKNYLPEGLSMDDALVVHRAFLNACEDESASAETIFARMASVARSFENIGKNHWPAAAGFYLKSADARLPAAQVEQTDPFNLLHALCGLIVATGKPISPRLQHTITDIETALHATLDWKNMVIDLRDDSSQAYDHMHNEWNKKYASIYAPLLRRWLKMQLSLALFPFAGLGDSLVQRITIIGVRLATLRLAIMASCVISDCALSDDEVVRVVQSLSRVLDHLGDSQFSLKIYTETKWLEEARMLGLLSI